MVKVAVVILASALMVGCSTSRQYTSYNGVSSPKPDNCSLREYTEGSIASVKNDFVLIGDMRVADTGLSINCSREVVEESIRRKACQEGADAVEYYDIVYPNIRSTCFQTRARFYVTK